MRYTYRSKTKRLSRRNWLIGLVGVLLLVAVLSLSAWALRLGPFNEDTSGDVGIPTKETDYNPPTSDQIEAGDEAKKQTEGGAVGSDPSPEPIPPTDGSSKSTVGMEITAANVESGTLYLRTLVQTVTNSGNCTVSGTGPGGKTYSANAGIQAGPSTSTCKGFNIPVGELSPGTWQFRVNFENDSLQGSASTEKMI